MAEHLAGHSEGKDDGNTDRYGLFSGLDAFPKIITRSTQAGLGLWASAVINTLALNLIADVMKWDNAVATREYAWLRLMSDVKYDGYSDFRSGIRFLESLVTWLKQFEPANRATAYQFVKDRMVYISAAEMQRVIELFVPETVIPYLRRIVAEQFGVKPYDVWGNHESAEALNQRLRRCLFIGLSDGSRIDLLRRENAGRLSQEQIVPMMNIGHDKWQELSEDLYNLQVGVSFEDVYLIDDFTASGTTFIRQVNNEWKGKLVKFNRMIKEARENLAENFPVAEGYTLHIHHYVSTHQAHCALQERVDEAKKWPDCTFCSAIITEGTRLPDTLKMGEISPEESEMRATDNRDAPTISLCKQYYDPQLYERLKKHCNEVGQMDMRYGYANCALPLVLEHNTPNNTISLIWAETNGTLDHAMRPLFRRRDRHG